MPHRIFPLRISLVIMGLSSITAQVLLLRELLVSFYGNELTLGVILANWLILEAFGSFVIGRTVEKTTRKLEAFVLFQLIFSLTLPLSIYLSRVFKNLLLTSPGEAVGFIPIFYSSLLILLPVAVPHGALFAYGSKLHSEYVREDASSIGKVYILETLGIILGGLLITYLLIPYLSPFAIAFILSAANSLISVLLLWFERRPPLRTLLGLSLLMAVFSVTGLLSPALKQIEQASVQSQWKEMGLIHIENSIYGNIAVTRRGEQFTFFADGVPVITAPVPDIASIEDLVHFPMLLHEKPESVLVLAGGAGGLLHEVLKYPVTRVDYVELDPLLLKLVKQYSTPLTGSELSDSRVKVHYTDGRFFVQRTADRFDILFIGLSSPQELRINRFFSAEFFMIAKEKMHPQGIIVLSLPGSLTYLSKELKELNGCILDTLRKVYPFVRVIPGDTNLYLASNSDRLENVSADEMYRRLVSRHVETRLITRPYLQDRLNERWQEWFSQSMKGRTIRINSDFHPLGVYFSLAYWNALFSPYLSEIFQAVERLTLGQTSAFFAIFSLLAALLFILKPGTSIQSVPYAIFTTGLAGMVFNLSIIFNFQILCGYLYHQIGLLVAIFMAGIAFGSVLMTTRLKKPRKEPFLFLQSELAVILFSFLLPYLFFALARHFREAPTGALFQAVFWGTSFLSGSLTGLQFPLATKIYLDHSPMKGTVGRTAGLIYGVDLLGGFFGGLLGGVLFLPVLGLKETCFLMATIKMSSFLLFFVFTRTHK